MARRLGRFQSDIPELKDLDIKRYENIFRVYETDDDEQYFFYNILNTVYLPDDIDPSFYDRVITQKKMAWTVLSFEQYGTMDLWWLIVLTNKIFNPIIMPPAGTSLKIIKPQFLQEILDEINRQLG